MNRILWATILGLLLGAIIFGMWQRGRGAEAEPEMGPRAVAPAPERQAAPSRSLRPERAPLPSGMDGPQYLSRSSTSRAGDVDRGASSDAALERIRAEQRRRAAEQRAQRQLEASRADGGPTRRNEVRERMAALQQARQRRAELRRQQALQLQQSRTRPSGQTSGAQIDAQPEPTPGESDAAVRAREAAEAREAFRDQINDSGDAGDGSEPNAADADGDGDGDDSDELGFLRPNNNDADNAAPPNSLSGVGQTATTFFSSNRDDDADDGDATPPPPDDGDDGEPTTPPPSPGDGGDDSDNGGGAPPPPPPPPAPPVTFNAEWRSVPRDAGVCDNLRGTVTNDLFLTVSRPVLLTVVTSPPSLGLRVEGGEFAQAQDGSNLPPAPAQIAGNPCLEFDSFLAMGSAAVSLAPGGPDPSNWGSALNATWFGIPGASAAPDPGRFGDAIPRAHIGRFTVTGNPQSVSGMLTVQFVDLTTGQSGVATVQAPNEPAIWTTDEQQTPQQARIDALSFFTPTTLAGAGLRVDIGLDRPAAEDVQVALFASSSTLRVPSTITIPKGVESRFFIVTTDPMIEEREEIVLTAISSAVVLRATVIVDPRIPGDLNGDGAVNGVDLGRLLSAWGSANQLADLNQDGAVDGADLGRLLGAWTATPSPPTGGPVIAKWIPVPIGADCADELSGVRSGDLYLGFKDPIVARATVIASREGSGLRVQGGAFHQAALVNSNGPPSPGVLAFDPCARFDSYLTIGDAPPTFIVQPPLDWGSELVAEWFTLSFDFIQVEQNIAKFGDSRRYLRIGRFSAPVGSSVEGTLRVIASPEEGDQLNLDLFVESDPAVFGEVDFNRDGVVDAADVELLTARMAAGDPSADLDASGGVDGADLRILIEMMGRELR